METDTGKNDAMDNQTFKSFQFKLYYRIDLKVYDKLYHGIFPLFYENQNDLIS